ncbi:MAG: twin-arginine translocation pathway signal protein [Rubrivivax sp. SCN 70-15]|nr:MAG: twin-arginine translocation pathway signal protein [Rubrivivax sp. SCN 70-15]
MPASTRRRFLHHTVHLAAAGALPALSAPARASLAGARELMLHNTHTQERIDLVYAVQARYVPEALGSLNHFLRDHYTGDIGRIDPRLFDLLHDIRRVLGSAQPFEVISGYRCATTNARLRATGGGGVAQHSLHMEGRAIDVRLPGVPLADLRDAARSLRAGGVGFYPRDQFVHVDTGRVRHW